MQSGPALPGKDQVYHMSWSKMVLILVIFPLQKSGKLVPKEVRCMARCLGHAADAILCREVFMSQSTMFWWRWIILGLLTKLFLNSQKKPFSSLCCPAKEMCLQFSGRNMGFRVRDLHSHHSLKVLSHQWVASQDFKLDCLKLVPSILSLKKKKIYIYIYIYTHTHTHILIVFPPVFQVSCSRISVRHILDLRSPPTLSSLIFLAVLGLHCGAQAFLAMVRELSCPHGVDDLSSLTRVWTESPCLGRWVLATDLPGKSPCFLFEC